MTSRCAGELKSQSTRMIRDSESSVLGDIVILMRHSVAYFCTAYNDGLQSTSTSRSARELSSFGILSTSHFQIVAIRFQCLVLNT